MTEPLQFTSATPRLGLPNIFAAQAQREAFVNEAFARIDMLLHAVIEGIASAPPSEPQNGECWIVGAGATGEWAGHDDAIAGYQAGSWHFAGPIDGMRVFDRSDARSLHFSGDWVGVDAPPLPVGGAVEDAELRVAFASLVEALRITGIFPVI